jgi:hypothetical protein
MVAGGITIEVLQSGFAGINRHDAMTRAAQHDMAKLIAPYAGQSLEVLLAARELAAASVGERVLHPHEFEEYLAIVRATGRKWGQE